MEQKSEEKAGNYVEIEIPASDILDGVKLLTGYIGVKREHMAEDFDRVSAISEDDVMLCTILSECVCYLAAFMGEGRICFIEDTRMVKYRFYHGKGYACLLYTSPSPRDS